jgi:hypothetical protein
VPRFLPGANRNGEILAALVRTHEPAEIACRARAAGDEEAERSSSAIAGRRRIARRFRVRDGSIGGGAA